MNVQEVEAKMVAQITGLEEQESRLQEWLQCLRKLDGIAAQWQSEAIDAATIETSPEDFEEVEMVCELDAVHESLQQAHEERIAEEKEAQMAEDPFDELRRRLAGKSECKSQPVFNTGLLFGANA